MVYRKEVFNFKKGHRYDPVVLLGWIEDEFVAVEDEWDKDVEVTITIVYKK